MYYIVLYPQNGDRIVTIDAVTSFHPMYKTVVLTTRRGRHRDKTTTREYGTSALYAKDAIVSRPEALVSPMTSSARVNGTSRTGNTSVNLRGAHAPIS